MKSMLQTNLIKAIQITWSPAVCLQSCQNVDWNLLLYNEVDNAEEIKTKGIQMKTGTWYLCLMVIKTTLFSSRIQFVHAFFNCFFRFEKTSFQFDSKVVSKVPDARGFYCVENERWKPPANRLRTLKVEEKWMNSFVCMPQIKAIPSWNWGLVWLLTVSWPCWASLLPPRETP